MKPAEARSEILEIIKSISDERIRSAALKAALNYFKTQSIVEKKVYRDRIITFYSEWLKRINETKRKEKIKQMRKLLVAAKR